MKIKYKIDMVIVSISLLALMFVIGYSQPLVIAPLDDFNTTETEVLFSIEKADRLLIDDNLDFTTPKEYSVEDGLRINLKPGRYYWKVVGVMSSEIRTLTINSKVSLEFVEGEEDFDVVNAGNTRLSVDIYNGTELIGQKTLDVSETMEVEGTKLVGEMDE